MPRADRLFLLVQLLTGVRFRSLAELTGETGRGPRTVYRDLADLEERGLPIEREGGGYRILQSATLRPLPLTDRERMLLAIALDQPVLRRQESFRHDLAQLRRKLVAVHALSSPAVVAGGPDRSGAIAAKVVESLERSIGAAHSVSILYASLNSGTRAWRNVDPWLLLHRSEAWYLLGRCHRHDEPRVFRLDRIGEVLPIGSPFTRPADLDAEAWFGTAWGVIRGSELHEGVVLPSARSRYHVLRLEVAASSRRRSPLAMRYSAQMTSIGTSGSTLGS